MAFQWDTDVSTIMSFSCWCYRHLIPSIWNLRKRFKLAVQLRSSQVFGSTLTGTHGTYHAVRTPSSRYYGKRFFRYHTFHYNLELFQGSYSAANLRCVFGDTHQLQWTMPSSRLTRHRVVCKSICLICLFVCGSVSLHCTAQARLNFGTRMEIMFRCVGLSLGTHLLIDYFRSRNLISVHLSTGCVCYKTLPLLLDTRLNGKCHSESRIDHEKATITKNVNMTKTLVP